MSWWQTALYDTCSLIVLDKMLTDRPSLRRHFPPSIRAIEASFASNQMKPATAKRINKLVTLQPLPTSLDALCDGSLPISICRTEKLIFVTASHFHLSVVTMDRVFAVAVDSAGLRCTDLATIIRELVTTKKLTSQNCEQLLINLANNGMPILGARVHSWSTLQKHRFLGNVSFS